MALTTNTQNGSENEAKWQLGMALSRPFSFIGRATIPLDRSFRCFGGFPDLGAAEDFATKQLSKIFQQIYYIGARSMMIIMLVSLFTGMVLGLQSYYALVKFGAQGALGTLVTLTLVRELGPVLTAIMIAARAGSAISAEIGIQRISEQIDALETMRIDPLRYLISQELPLRSSAFPCLPLFLISSALSAATSQEFCFWGKMPAPIFIAFKLAWR